MTSFINNKYSRGICECGNCKFAKCAKDVNEIIMSHEIKMWDEDTRCDIIKANAYSDSDFFSLMKIDEIFYFRLLEPYSQSNFFSLSPILFPALLFTCVGVATWLCAKVDNRRPSFLLTCTMPSSLAAVAAVN